MVDGTTTDLLMCSVGQKTSSFSPYALGSVTFWKILIDSGKTVHIVIVAVVYRFFIRLFRQKLTQENMWRIELLTMWQL